VINRRYDEIVLFNVARKLITILKETISNKNDNKTTRTRTTTK
jgi:hypothetical protein